MGYIFDPIRPGRYAEAYLFLQVPKVIMESATIRPKTAHMCHVSNENMTFHEFPSDFDPNRTPIYYIPTMRVDSKAEDLGMLWAVVDRVLAKRRDRKGVIHSTSYTRQEEIRDRSRFKESMILNTRGEPVANAMEEFFAAGPGSVFVSPSVCEGYDFKQDKARFQFMCKIPFQPPSKIVKAREADDKEYRSYMAMQALVQSFGRGMREHSDWCENFIADMHMDWFYPKYKHLAPKSFTSFIRPVNILPPPMKF
jgi:Rad3-related DNA helicase